MYTVSDLLFASLSLNLDEAIMVSLFGLFDDRDWFLGFEKNLEFNVHIKFEMRFRFCAIFYNFHLCQSITGNTMTRWPSQGGTRGYSAFQNYNSPSPPVYPAERKVWICWFLQLLIVVVLAQEGR